MLFRSRCLTISGNYDFLGIDLAEPRIFQQPSHSAMFVGRLRSERCFKRLLCFLQAEGNLSAAQTASEGWLACGRLLLK